MSAQPAEHESDHERCLSGPRGLYPARVHPPVVVQHDVRRHARSFRDAAVRTGLWLLAGSIFSCAPSLKQVPSSAPHAVLHFRIVHKDEPDAMVEDSGRIGRETFKLRGSGDREQRVRVSPGWQYVELTSLRTTYGLDTADVEVREYQDCGPQCMRGSLATRRMEPRTTLQPTDESRCALAESVDLPVNAQKLVLVVVGPKAKCATCITEDLTARECPATAPTTRAPLP